MSEYTREEILKMIKDNGGPEGLDLSAAGLAGLDLGWRAIEEELKRVRENDPQASPTWYSRETEGINLRQANLLLADCEETNLARADLERAELWDGMFSRARLWEANLRKAILTSAALDEADLSGANLQEATLPWTDLRGANLRGARLEAVDLFSAENLEGVHLCGAFLDRTKMRWEQLGGRVGEEIEGDFRLAREAYLGLKSNFNSLGRYDNASKAYVKERQMEKKTHWPLSYALECYGESELPKVFGKWSRRLDLLRFYLRHLRLFITDWIIELLCLYGESPLRVVAWAAAFAFLIFPLSYALFGGVGTTDGSPVTRSEYLRLSLASFATIELAGVQAQGIAAQFLRTLEALTGISLLALLMFTLGNRISRS